MKLKFRVHPESEDIRETQVQREKLVHLVQEVYLVLRDQKVKEVKGE
jgi:hypothetical protein